MTDTIEEKAQLVADALTALVELKKHKDVYGKDEYYKKHVDAVWSNANYALAVWEREDD